MRLSRNAFLIPRMLAAVILLAALLGGGGTIPMPGWLPSVLFVVAGGIVLVLIVLGMRLKRADDARSVVETLPDDVAERIWAAVRGQDSDKVRVLLSEAGVGDERVRWVSRHLTTEPTKI